MPNFAVDLFINAPNNKRLRGYYLIILSFLFLPVLSYNVLAFESEEKEFNPGEMVIHHIRDAHEWHFAVRPF